MARILVVEDSLQLQEYIVDFYERKGNFEVDRASDGRRAMELIASVRYDLVILDIMLPGPSGFEICRELRRKNDCPVIFLTALGNEDNILRGYEIGADEYMVKPFSLKVLYAKSLALLNRTANEMRNEKTIECGSLKLFPLKMEVFEGDEEIILAPKEYFLLKVLVENQGHVLSREKLLRLVWGYDNDVSDRVVDSHIKKLRKKLTKTGKQIKTVIGSGYKIVPEGKR